MRTKLALTALTASLLLAACGSDAEGGDGGDTDGALTVGASTVPHAEILQFVSDELAEDAGLDLDIVEFTDYIQPNVALDDGSLDANYFQHEPYLAEQEADAGYDFEAVTAVHLEPLALYSELVNSVDELPDGAQIAIPNDPTNGARALELLAGEGLITLADTGDSSATVLDIDENPKNLDFTEIEAAQLPRSLTDVDGAVINGNYAVEADLSPAEDSIAVEDADDNPYANLLVTVAGQEDNADLQKLAELLNSDEVRQFIDETYDGAVIAAF